MEAMEASFVRVQLARHYLGGKPYGLWVRIPKAVRVLPANLCTDRKRRLAVGVVGRQLVIALYKPSEVRTSLHLSRAIPSNAEWAKDDELIQDIRWYGISEALMVREPKYTARIYIPKHIADDILTPDSDLDAPATLWAWGPAWLLLTIDIP